MLTKTVTMLASVVLGGMIAFPAVAADTGENDYMTLCATCHGVDGDGMGPFTEMITDKVPDLTTLSANNNGVFPMLNIVHIIDGRTGLRGHGGAMPIYGDLFATETEDVTGVYGGVTIVRGRILSLVYYLESIQK